MKRNGIIRLLTAAIILPMLLPVLLPAPAACEGEAVPLSLLAINVRKADALLLRSGESAYLIDTGTEDSFEKLYSVLKQEGITRLTGVIVTHTDKDHSGGLEQLVDSDIEIGNVYASAYFKKKKISKHPAVKALQGTGTEVIFLSGGDELGPLEKDEDKENNNSLVLLAEGGGGSMLLAGDMEFPEEDSLLAAGVISHADVIKIANHGEDDATSNALINAVRPSLAVISTNTADEPDTPSKRVMALLKSWVIPVLVTQDTENGVLVTISDGEIKTEMK